MVIGPSIQEQRLAANGQERTPGGSLGGVNRAGDIQTA